VPCAAAPEVRFRKKGDNMGIAHDLGLIGTDGEFVSIEQTIKAQTEHEADCAQLHKANTKSSTAYLLGRVDLINNWLVVSADGKVVGVLEPENPKLLKALALNSPTLCMIELFKSQNGWAARLHFKPELVA
jgi:hypothetical protein